MSMNLDTARARLRAADPADPHDALDTLGAPAKAMFEGVVAGTSEPGPVRVRSPHRRRLVPAGAAVAAVAAVAMAGVVTTPWSHGRPASAAYAIDRRPDGSINITVRWNELHDPVALNAELARWHARTVVVRESAGCHAAIDLDPAHSGPIRVDVAKHPELAKPGGLEALQRALQPWLTSGAAGLRGGVFTVHPGKIPAGDTLLIPYDFVSTRGAGGSVGPDALTFRAQLVRTVPPCVPGLPGR
jgi:hypothetical protein